MFLCNLYSTTFCWLVCLLFVPLILDKRGGGGCFEILNADTRIGEFFPSDCNWLFVAYHTTALILSMSDFAAPFDLAHFTHDAIPGASLPFNPGLS